LVHFRQQPPVAELMRFEIPAPGGAALSNPHPCRPRRWPRRRIVRVASLSILLGLCLAELSRGPRLPAPPPARAPLLPRRKVMPGLYQDPSANSCSAPAPACVCAKLDTRLLSFRDRYA
jgi:hypothetical protein